MIRTQLCVKVDFFLVVFTRKYILQRLLKKRYFKGNKYPTLRYGTIGVYCLHTFRFEYKYCMFIRKFFKKLYRHKKRKIATASKWRTWLFVRPNYVLTHKSKNARMGKGKGNFKRWCTIIYPGRVFIEHTNISPHLYRAYIAKLKNKLKLQLHICSVANKIPKSQTFTPLTNHGSGVFSMVRTRQHHITQLYM